MEDAEGSAARELIASGSDAAGAAVGAALGLFAGPLGVIPGAAGGALVAHGLKRVALEIQERWLTPRQRLRVADTYTLAAGAISVRLLAGDEPRNDGFFEDRDGERSPAEELLEGVLLRAADEHEERKLKYLSLLYSSLAFDSSVDPAYANYLLRVASGLTYGQLVCIALVGSPAHERQKIGVDVARTEGDAPASAAAVRSQLANLSQSDLLGAAESGVSLAGTYGGADSRSIDVGRLGLLQMGNDLYRLMRLDQIPGADLDELLARLGHEPVTP